VEKMRRKTQNGINQLALQLTKEQALLLKQGAGTSAKTRAAWTSQWKNCQILEKVTGIDSRIKNKKGGIVRTWVPKQQDVVQSLHK
jgi:hypothetical protein